MNKKIVLGMVVLIILGFLGVLYRENEKSPILTKIEMPVIPNGETVTITAPEGWNSFIVGETISLLVQNVSNDRIVFESDLGTEIYSIVNGTFIELSNKVSYQDIDNISLDPLTAYTLVIKPDISNSVNDVSLRVFIVGNIQKNEYVEGQLFATYIDLQLVP